MIYYYIAEKYPNYERFVWFGKNIYYVDDGKRCSFIRDNFYVLHSHTLFFREIYFKIIRKIVEDFPGELTINNMLDKLVSNLCADHRTVFWDKNKNYKIYITKFLRFSVENKILLEDFDPQIIIHSESRKKIKEFIVWLDKLIEEDILKKNKSIPC